MCVFFFNDTATTEIYTLSLHDALPICRTGAARSPGSRGCCWSGTPPASCGGSTTPAATAATSWNPRSEEHTSELQSQSNLVCRLLLEKKKETLFNHH